VNAARFVDHVGSDLEARLHRHADGGDRPGEVDRRTQQNFIGRDTLGTLGQGIGGGKGRHDGKSRDFRFHFILPTWFFLTYPYYG